MAWGRLFRPLSVHDRFVLWRLGRAASMGGPSDFVALCIPLPLQQDVALVTSLQKIAAGFAGGGLDLVGIRHRLQGVAIHVPGKTYFVEEACSGVNSLFSSIAFMAFYLLYRHRHWLRFVVGLLQIIVWVIVVNALRVFFVVYAEQRFEIDLTSGWLHQALGGFAFAVIVILAISGDYLILALIPVRPWNLGAETSPPRVATGGPSWRMAAGLAALLLLAATTGVSIRLARDDAQVAGQSALAVIHGITLDTLPETLGPWRRLEFWTENRESGDLQGAASSIWRFQRGATEVLFSIDGPFPQWHDLAYCYSSLDWKLIDAENLMLPRESQEESVKEPCTQLDFFTDQQRRAVVFFTCYDADNQPVQPLEPSGRFLRRLWDRLAAANPLGEKPRLDVKPPVIQAQMQVVTDEPLMEFERAELEDLFDQLRRIARGRAGVEQLGAKL